MIVYLATNTVNGKSYVGKTKRELEQRIVEHQKAATKGSTLAFHRALRKHGFASFEWKTLHSVGSHDELDVFERCCIETYGTLGKGGYNMTAGGDGIKDYRHTEDAKRRMSINRSGEKNCNFGKKFSDETKRKLSESHMGNTHTEETKQRLAEARRGKKASEATLQKFYKQVAQLDDEGREIRVFNSVIEAATQLSKTKELVTSARTGISRACRFPSKRALGFKWKYLEEKKV